MPNPNPMPTVRRLHRLGKLFVRSDYLWPAMGLFALLLSLVITLNRLNVWNLNVLAKLTNALKDREAELFGQYMFIFILSFVFLASIGAFKAFFELRLGLLLREGLTRHLFDSYLNRRAYLRLVDRPEVDNPDQRMTEDVRTLSVEALAFALILVAAAIDLISFARVLWDISGRLMVTAFGYSVIGTLMTILIGKKLVRLNMQQLKKEADLRFELVRTREHAEAIAVQHDEVRLLPRLEARLGSVIANLKIIIVRNSFLGQWTNFYKLMAQVAVPTLVVAPLYISGEITEFGVFAKAAGAFVFVVNAISVIVTEFPRLTQITAVVARLGELRSAIDDVTENNGIEIKEMPGRVAVEGLTLMDPGDGHRYVTNLNFEVNTGRHLMVVGPAGSGKSELMRALAGLWRKGHGRIVRPPLDQIAFLPPQPYLTPGSLRNLLLPDHDAAEPSDQKMLESLNIVGLSAVVERAGGLDAERDWGTLSLGERQALLLAEILVTPPRFAVLDEATSTLDSRTRAEFYTRLARAGTTIITLSAHPVLPDFHKQRLDLTLSSEWRITPIPA